jgi:hypothetical protein
MGERHHCESRIAPISEPVSKVLESEESHVILFVATDSEVAHVDGRAARSTQAA